MTMKGLPSSYNKDLQGDKEPLFDADDTLRAVLEIATGVLATLIVNPQAMRAALSLDMLATDLCYYLVRKGVPFRKGHELSGKCVALAEDKKCSLSDLKYEDFKTISSDFQPDVLNLWNYEASVQQYQADGGTSKEAVQRQIAAAEKWLQAKEAEREGY